MAKSTPLTLLFTVLAAFVGLCAVLYLLQERLIFVRQPLADGAHRALVALPGVTEHEVTAKDGTRLHGWIRHTAGEEAPPGLLVYFGGNAEEVSGQVLDADAFTPWSFAAFNYRGYGRSEGRPGEAALTADALVLFDWLAARADVDPERIVIFGRSLGGGVAVQLAARRTVPGVVLVSPFDSLRSLARSQYPFVPVSLLLRHPFDSLAHAPEIEAPVLVLAGERDHIVAPDRSRRLHDAWKGRKRWEALPGAGHNDIHAHPGYRPPIREFLATIGSAP